MPEQEIPLRPYCKIVDTTLTSSWVTYLEQLTRLINEEMAFLLVEVKPNALTENFDAVSLRIIDTEHNNKVLFVATGDSRGGRIIGPTMMPNQFTTQMRFHHMDYFYSGVLISDPNQIIQLMSTAEATNLLTFQYEWIKPNPYAAILNRRIHNELIEDIDQLGPAQTSAGQPFHKVGDQFHVD